MKYDIKASGFRIQQLRVQHGYTQLELAKKVNADRSYISYVESGKKGCSVDILGELSFAQIGELFGKSESWARVTYHRAKLKLREDTR